MTRTGRGREKTNQKVLQTLKREREREREYAMTVTWTLPKWFLLYWYFICNVVRVSNTLGGLLSHSSAYNQRLAEHNIGAVLQIKREGIVTAAIVWKAFHSLIVYIYREK